MKQLGLTASVLRDLVRLSEAMEGVESSGFTSERLAVTIRPNYHPDAPNKSGVIHVDSLGILVEDEGAV